MKNPVAGRATELAEFSAERFIPKTLFENERLKVILAGFEPGQEIPLHSPNIDLTLAVLDGVVEVMAGEAVRRLRAGDLAVIPAGCTRGVRAIGGRAVILHVVSPPPTAADHAAVAAGARWPAAERHRSRAAELVHEEHKHILPHIEHLRTLALKAESLTEPDLKASLGDVLAFLREALLPHAALEEKALYPAVDLLMRAVGRATATMSIDHQAITALINELARLQSAQPLPRRDLALTLASLETLLRVHFSKEEEVYTPLLSQLEPQQDEALANRLHGEASAMVSHQHP